jgi:hypothetical protein
LRGLANPVTPDHYATLGLSPTSEDVVIHAAYRALVRRYHPDGNSSDVADARTRAINAAYAVLGDPGRRAEYDRVRAAEDWSALPQGPRSRLLPSGLFAAASILLLVALVLVVVWAPLPAGEKPLATPSEQGPPVAASQPDPAIDSPEPLVSPLESPPPEPLDPPIAADEAALIPPLQLDEPLPPPPPRPASSPRVRVPKARPVTRTVAARTVAGPAVAGAGPSFDCTAARTRGEIAVCNSANLASLDRQQALLFGQSWGRADAARRAELLRTRDRFLTRRDRCRSDSCATTAYLARLRELSEIMTGPPRPPQSTPLPLPPQ